jgi:hypothetical protein
MIDLLGRVSSWPPYAARGATITITRSAAELLARASSREPVVPADARSGAVFEQIVVGPDRYFVKRLSAASDWIMRASGDRVCRQYLV